ncbi:hypothetical protein [Nocardia sp. NBC_01327]|uniref:hypothetical protein n=1 Tax=Nocardia sp. NBC_01327 TaxID=2903593 RepID=UPI002E15B1C9|nr:hypothetical protein OG326_26620 [Nocardia sp. NBC_01327]
MRIDGIDFAAVAGREDPHLGRPFRGHVQDGFPVADQAVRDMAADAVAALDRPDPVGESACGGE